MKASNNIFLIREINPDSKHEIDKVAQNMRATLVDVMGEERGQSFYSMEWLLARVRWHLDRQQTNAKIFLAEEKLHGIVGQAIVRIEQDESQNSYGYFSTIYVDPNFRRQGLGSQLIKSVEAWLSLQEISLVVYNTAATNSGLLNLFEREGYKIHLHHGDMVQLQKKFFSH